MNTGKKIIALMLSLCMLLPLFPSAAASGSTSYVALGDSIAAGFSLPGYTGNGSTPSSAFPTRVASGTKGCTLTDLAISGWDTGNLLDALKTSAYKTAVGGADVITLTIGSNDLLLPAIYLILSYLGIDSTDDLTSVGDIFGADSFAKLVSLNTYLNSAEAAAVFDEAVSSFEANWDTLIDAIYGMNPDATVIVTSYYNPYADFNFGTMINIGNIAQTYLNRMNSYIKANKYNGSYYRIVDITGVSTYVDISFTNLAGSSFDPHPDMAGHAYIAKKVLTKLKELRPDLTITLQGMSNFAKDKAVYSGFDDVDENAWYGTNNQGAIKSALQLGIVNGKGAIPGVGANCFDPGGQILICEAIKMACIVHGTYYYGRYAGSTAWYSGYVDYAIENGIISAYDFISYTAPATRAQMAYIFANALPESELAAINTVSYGNIPDVGMTTEYAGEILLLYRAGVLTGDTGTNAYRPSDSISRAEASAIITRVALTGERKSLSFQK